MNVLITGGAGYIGSHVNKLLTRNGYRTVVYDNLSGGHRELAKWGRFIQGDLADGEALGQVIRQNNISAVFHFASFLNVTESVSSPFKYYQNNVCNTLNLLEAMRAGGCDTLVFSSTCAVYGEPDSVPITEDMPRRPINPYGRTKAMVEQMFEDYAAAYGLKYVALRYFNAAGADPEGETGEWHVPEPHIIPRLLNAALSGDGSFQIYGDDYDTRDGTCIRDYIHVSDLAEAHLLALRYLQAGNASDFFNLGNATGVSNLEIVRSVLRVTGRPLLVTVAKRRPGDPSVLVGDSRKAREILRWRPQYPDIDTIVAHAWNWRQRLPGLSTGGEPPNA
jgi:UDP-glucose-4-epimerase GalE